MKSFVQIKTEEADFNVFNEVGKKWLLITAFDKEKGRVNAMTASWGCAGILWNKPVCVLFVRPQRHTYKLLEESDTLSVNILEEKYRDAHKICGSLSGRDLDKIAESGLTTLDLNGLTAFEQSEKVMTLKKLYADDLRENSFIDKALLANYKSGDYHKMYVCEITGLYEAKNLQ